MISLRHKRKKETHLPHWLSLAEVFLLVPFLRSSTHCSKIAMCKVFQELCPFISENYFFYISGFTAKFWTELKSHHFVFTFLILLPQLLAVLWVLAFLTQLPLEANLWYHLLRRTRAVREMVLYMCMNSLMLDPLMNMSPRCTFLPFMTCFPMNEFVY